MMTLKRKKTDTKNIWDLEYNDTIVGRATSRQKTSTQRVWDATVTINGTTYSVNDMFSIKRAVTELESQMNASTVSKTRVTTSA